jgi:ribosomal protein S11
LLLLGNVFITDSSNNRIRMVTVSTGIITTIAGDGSTIFSGDNGPATSAALNHPSGVAVDSSGTTSKHFTISLLSNTILCAKGSMYIADFGNYRVRKVSTGIITTFAGTGASSYIGDNGQATSAAFLYPTGVALDDSGNIYIADTLNNRIRKVTVSTGIITTIAGTGTGGYSGDGGEATSATLNYPFDVSLDASGNVYIADDSDNRIRKVTVSTGIITTIAGNGTAGFSGDNGPATSAACNYPTGVALDPSGIHRNI